MQACRAEPVCVLVIQSELESRRESSLLGYILGEREPDISFRCHLPRIVREVFDAKWNVLRSRLLSGEIPGVSVSNFQL
jgi:hypothetical protein